ncbi:MAG: LysR family transcriptional regulator [Burkholderiaceae bacterium]
MTFKQLEAFYWAATCANFAVAADRLHLSISSLSKRIVELEESLNRPLFDRTGRKAELTEAGRQLMPHARALLQAASAARQAVATESELSGRSRFGVGELSALTWLPQFMLEARLLYPQLVLEPHVDVGAELEQKVDKGELDFAVIAGRSSKASIQSQSIANAQFSWTASPKICKTGQKIDQTLFALYPLITQPTGAGTTLMVDDWLAAQSVIAEQRVTCNNWGAIAGMLVEGMGIGFLPKGWAESLQKRQLLVQLQTISGLAALSYSCQWRRDDHRPLITKMVTLLQTQVDFSGTSKVLDSLEKQLNN